MSTFSVKIITILEEYKEILRSFLPLKEANARIHRIGLANNRMLCANDIVLYKIAHRALNDLQIFMKRFNANSVWQLRLQDYLEVLRKNLEEFYPENNRVINLQQETSRLTLEVIQILSLPVDKIILSAERIKNALQKIHEYGILDQYRLLKALSEKKFTEHNLDIRLISIET